MAGKGVSSAAHLLLALIFLSWTLSSAQYMAKTAILDDTVTLTCNTSCKGPRTWTDGDGNVVAHSEVDGRCTYADGYENIKMLNDSKDGKQSLDLVISPVHFNDQGFFHGTCDGHYCDYKLQVLAPQRVIAYTGENITIPCYAVTNKNEKDQQIYLRWDKNGEMGVKLDGVLTPGVIPMDRGRISKDGYKRGDLSLRLSSVRPSDEGLYQCQYSPRRDADKFQGAPNSVVLEVRVSTFQVQDDALVTVPVIFDGPVAVFFRGHDGGPEDEVCTLSEGQPQCTPQHGGMFAMQDGKLTFTRGSSTRGGVYSLKDKGSGRVLYRFNVTMAAKGETWPTSAIVVVTFLCVILVPILVALMYVGWSWRSARERRLATSAGQYHAALGQDSRDVQLSDSVPEVDDEQLSAPSAETGTSSEPWELK